MEIQQTIRTLIVDDSAVFLKALGLFLSQLPNIEVVGSAANGNEAVDRTVALSPQLVLMDLEMPGMDGLQAMARIRQLCPSTRVIIVTVHDSNELRTLCMIEGAHEFVPKNRLKKELPSAIRALFRESGIEEIDGATLVMKSKPSEKKTGRTCLTMSGDDPLSNTSCARKQI